MREAVARRQIVAALRERLLSEDGIAFPRKRIAEKLGELTRTRRAEIEERQKRLGRTESRIAGLVQFISDGDQSSYVRSTLVDLEAQARSEKEAIEAIRREATEPIHLPSPREIEVFVADLDAELAQDPLRARELLRRVLKDGRIVLEPQPGGVYLARAAVLPLRVLAERDHRRSGDKPGAAMSSASSGGVI